MRAGFELTEVLADLFGDHRLLHAMHKRFGLSQGKSQFRRRRANGWCGLVSKAVARLMRMHDAFGIIPEERFSNLSWNLRQTFWYLRSNAQYLVNYARRHNKGLPISSSIAESAVNEIVSWRMAKKRQMRWSDEGAHLLAQVRVHELNGELRPRQIPFSLRPPKLPHDPKWDAYLMLEAA